MRPQHNSAYACSKTNKKPPKTPSTEKVKNKATRITSGMESIVWRKTVIALAFSVTETLWVYDCLPKTCQENTRKIKQKDNTGIIANGPLINLYGNGKMVPQLKGQDVQARPLNKEEWGQKSLNKFNSIAQFIEGILWCGIYCGKRPDPEMPSWNVPNLPDPPLR